MATQLQKLMFSIGLLDKVTGPAGRIKKTLGSVANTAQESFGKIAGGAAGVVASGYAMTSLATPAHEFNMAIGEVRSLDVAQSSLDALSNSAVSFSVKYGGTAAEFVKSSYDIQSAIAGLVGDELASFTDASNILAKGTKSDAATITSYMGTMYGIFKGSADSMGKAQWVEQMTGQTATAVQMFKTTGVEMASAFSSIGAGATSAGIAQSEQMSILGSLQATMSGSEAGTKYGAFLSGIGDAQDKLGLKFTDSNG
ncbi:MAG: phage tail tape measure protein, partial [Desulforhopalus sp.]